MLVLVCVEEHMRILLLSSVIQHYIVLHTKFNEVQQPRIDHGLRCESECGPEYKCGFLQVNAFSR